MDNNTIPAQRREVSKNEGLLGTHVKHLLDLQFTVVASVYSGYAEFTVHDIEGMTEAATEGTPDIPAWRRAGDSSSLIDSATRLEDAEVFVHGSVKWDGCSNWHFDKQDRGMLHGCSRNDIQRFGDVLAACWDWTAELCPGWDALVAE